MLARTSWPIPLDPEENPPGIYWTPAQRAENDEVHPKLLQAIAQRSGMRLHIAALYETDCGAPVGYLDLATDPETHEPVRSTSGAMRLRRATARTPCGFPCSLPVTVLLRRWSAGSSDRAGFRVGEVETETAATSADAELTVEHWAAAVVAAHEGNHLAAISTLLEDNAHLRHQIAALAQAAMSKDFTRGWMPSFEPS